MVQKALLTRTPQMEDQGRRLRQRKLVRGLYQRVTRVISEVVQVF